MYVVEAAFVMVSRNPLLHKGSLVNGLEASNDAERAILATSEIHQQNRKAMADESLLKTCPTEDERTLIHSLFLDTLDPSASTFRLRHKPEGVCS